MISSFKPFGIKLVPRINNVVVDILTNAAARFTLLKDCFSIENAYKAIVPKNITNFHVLDDYQNIVYFISNVDVFKDVTIHEE